MLYMVPHIRTTAVSEMLNTSMLNMKQLSHMQEQR